MVGNDHQCCRTVPLDVELDPSESGDLDVERETLFVGDCDASIGYDDPCGRDRMWATTLSSELNRGATG